MNKVIVKGKARGTVLKSEKPINFLGAVDKKSGRIRDREHPLHDRSVKDHVLVFPHGIGSSVGAYTIYSLKSSNASPAAMICRKADLTVATGCALANIPLVLVHDYEFDQLNDGEKITIDTESGGIC